MSTRATYLLPAAHYKDQWICFFIQNDGYPAGAADYFHKMHHCKNMSGGYAGRFIRANDKAEFTRSHEAHEDTYFRYTLNTQGELRVWAKGMGGNRWRILYEDPWYNFVNTYLKESEHLHLFQLSKNLQHETIMTVCEAERWVTAMTNS
ncbi:MAG TPA: hypothetical protein VGU44_00345, partial [Gammaproteobacteria bacterium]|nr:hypothetical protein [Gammaproteobacteria bacterium]